MQNRGDNKPLPITTTSHYPSQQQAAAHHNNKPLPITTTSHCPSQQQATAYHNNKPLPITTQTRVKQRIVFTSRATSFMSNRQRLLVSSVNNAGGGADLESG